MISNKQLATDRQIEHDIQQQEAIENNAWNETLQDHGYKVNKWENDQ